MQIKRFNAARLLIHDVQQNSPQALQLPHFSGLFPALILKALIARIRSCCPHPLCVAAPQTASNHPMVHSCCLRRQIPAQSVPSTGAHGGGQPSRRSTAWRQHPARTRPCKRQNSRIRTPGLRYRRVHMVYQDSRGRVQHSSLTLSGSPSTVALRTDILRPHDQDRIPDTPRGPLRLLENADLTSAPWPEGRGCSGPKWCACKSSLFSRCYGGEAQPLTRATAEPAA